VQSETFASKTLSELGDVEERCWDIGQGFVTCGYGAISSTSENFPHWFIKLQSLYVNKNIQKSNNLIYKC